MKKMSSIVQVLIVTILFLSSCKKNEFCEGNKLGNLTLSERSDNFIVYDNGEVLTFVNQEGEELIGSTSEHELNTRVNLEVIGEGYEALNGTSSTCHNYYDIIRRNNGIGFEKSEASINISVSYISDNNVNYKERLTFGLNYKNDSKLSVIGYYDYETEELANPIYENYGGNEVSVKSKINELDLNGKIFTDVLAAEIDGSAIYFKESIGVIGFSINGDVWVIE